MSDDPAAMMEPNVTLTNDTMDERVDGLRSDPVIDLTDECISSPPPDLAKSLKRPWTSNDTNLDTATSQNEEIDLTEIVDEEEESVVVVSKSQGIVDGTSEGTKKKKAGSWKEIEVSGGGAGEAGEAPIDLTMIDDSRSTGTHYPPAPSYETVCYGLVETLLTGAQMPWIAEGFAGGATMLPVLLQPCLTPIVGVYCED